MSRLEKPRVGQKPIHLQLVETMAAALDARDPYTAGHSVRVADYAYAAALELGVPKRKALAIRLGAQLHDIGKIGVPDALLQKPGRLSDEEFGLIKLHPQIGRKILERVGQFGPFLDIVELHHENVDGSGYPYGLRGDDIPMDARIVHVADAFDAMTSDRAYRSALRLDHALDQLRRNRGRQFDERVVTAFLHVIDSGTCSNTLEAAMAGIFWMPKPGGPKVEMLRA
jgi:putative nucleotidyltransferase with HDIG domain